MPSVTIDFSLYCHIALDPELSGVQGVQGNQLSRPITYLTQYLTHQTQSSIDHILINRLNRLAHYSQRCESLHTPTETDAALFTNEIALEIQSLSDNQGLFLPGSWIFGHQKKDRKKKDSKKEDRKNSHAHAVLYEVVRCQEGYEFRIYNSGFGLSAHEFESTPAGERYSIVWRWKIPAIDLATLQGFIYQLYLPSFKLHPEQDTAFNTSHSYYTYIRSLLIFLNAELTPIHTVTELNGTVGQITGTCTLYCIYVMLQIYFKDMARYQRFLLDFRVYALNEFLQAHPLPYSQSMHDLLHLSIEDHLKHLQIPNLLPVSQKEQIADGLLRIKRQLNGSNPIKPYAADQHVTLGSYTYTLKAPELGTSTTDQQRHLPKGSYTTTRIEPLLLLLPVEENIDLEQYLKAVFEQCRSFNTLTSNDLLGIIIQIEHTLSMLPLPIERHPYSGIPKAKMISIIQSFNALHKLYSEVTLTFYRDPEYTTTLQQHASVIVTHWSFLALRNYFEEQLELYPGQKNIHNFVASCLRIQLYDYQYCAFMATNDPCIDQRYMTLKTMHNIPHTGRLSLDKIALYRAILQAYPQQKQLLERNYQHAPAQEPLHHVLVKEELHGLYYLLNDQSTLKTIDELRDVQFTPLLDALTHQMHFELAIARSLATCDSYPANERLMTLRLSHTTPDNLILQTVLPGHLGFAKAYPSFGWTYAISNRRYQMNPKTIELASRGETLVQAIKYNHIDTNYSLRALSKVPSATLRALINDTPNPQMRGDMKKISSNEIQISSHVTQNDQPLTKKDLFARDFFGLRTSSANQIKLILNYFKVTSQRKMMLSELNVQNYIEANLFEPGLLCAALAEDPTLPEQFMAAFGDFIHTNLAQEPEALFFVRLNASFHLYMVQYQPEFAQSHLDPLEANLIRLIEKPGNLPTVTWHLHHLLFLILMARYQFKAQSQPHQLFAKTLDSYCYLNTNPKFHSQLDIATSIQLKKAKHLFKQKIRQMPETLIIDAIRFTLRRFQPIAESTVNANMPIYDVYYPGEVEPISIHILSGIISKANAQYKDINPLIIHHPICEHFNLNSALMGFADQNTLEFCHNGRFFRIRYHESKITNIYRKWTIYGMAEWFELYALTAEQSRGRYKILPNTLPLALKATSVDAWVHVATEKILLTRHERPFYYQRYSPPFADQLEKMTENGMLTGEILVINDDPDLTQFEDPQFILTHQNVSNQTRTIHFIRYDLVLHQNAATYTLANTNDQLLPRECSPFGPQVACLSFSDGSNSYCIVAIQRFYDNPDYFKPEKDQDGDYFHSEHDRTRFIKEYYKQALQKENPTDCVYTEYENTEKFMTLKMVNGKPQAHNAVDSLRLSYIYLATHQPEAAWDALDTMNKRFCLEGSQEELEALHWILNALPFRTTENYKVDLTSPRYIACKLKALVQFTELISHRKKLHFPTPRENNFKYTEQFLNTNRLSLLHLTQQYIPIRTHHLYYVYQRIRSHLASTFMLDDNEANSLLWFVHHHRNDKIVKHEDEISFRPMYMPVMPVKTADLDDPDQDDPDINSHDYLPAGSVNYDRMLLQIKGYVKEHARIKAMIARHEWISNDLFKHFEALSTLLDNDETPYVLSYKTKFKQKSIDLVRVIDAYDDINDWLIQPHDAWLFYQEPTPEKISSALNILTSVVRPLQLCEHLITYVQIAVNEHAGGRTQLLQFCESYYKAYPDSKSSNTRPYLSFLVSVLYRMLHSQKELKKYIRRLLPDGFMTFLPENSKCSIMDIHTELSKSQHTLPAIFYQERKVYILSPISADSEQALSTAGGMARLFHYDDSTPLKITSLLNLSLSRQIHAQLPDDVQEQFGLFYQAFERVDQDYQTHLKRLLHELELTSGGLEEEVGALIYQKMSMKQALTQQLTVEFLAAIYHTAKSYAPRLQADIEMGWSKCIQLGTQKLIPLDARINEASKNKMPLTKDRLLQLYLEGNYQRYHEETALYPQDADTLHQAVHHCLTLEILNQQLLRFLAEEKNGDIKKMVNQLLAINQPEAERDPIILLFQYQKNILLTTSQLEALAMLCATDHAHKYHELVLKFFMGFGKSKVILPLLALKKANGFNLVVLEVPRTLIATNHADLYSETNSLFKQKALIFDFSRKDLCSRDALQEMYDWLGRTISNKDFIVTVGESRRSLELKWRAFLLSRPENLTHINQWKNQVFLLGKVRKLFRTRADAIIDEVHLGLKFTNKLNYTLGARNYISPDLIKLALGLYEFINQLTDETNPGSTLKSRVTNDWVRHAENLVNLLCDHRLSPLKIWVSDKEQLRAYLNGQHDELIHHSSTTPYQRKIFAFYKLQVSLLPHTLSRIHNTHYGPARKVGQKASLDVISVPYKANNHPSERSKYSNPIVTINYVIQSLCLSGLHENLLIEQIELWQAEAQEQLHHMHTQSGNRDLTEIGGIANHFLQVTGLSLEVVDVKNKEHIRVIISHLQFDLPLLYRVMQDLVLSNIMLEPRILHGDAYQHVDGYHSVQGISGTLANHATYHQRLRFEKNTGLGMESYFRRVLIAKQTPIRLISFTTLNAYLLDLFNRPFHASSDKAPRAIIDINATFSGIPNATVAKELALFLNHSQSNFEYVLYFDEQDQLCALNCKTLKKIELRSSDPDEIDKKLTCSSKYRFTYFDQAHTVGADIKQSAHASAFVLIDNDTPLEVFFQGAMRMRELVDEQQIEIIGLNHLKYTTLHELFALMRENEINQLMEDNYYACLTKLHHIVEQDLCQLIEDIDEYDIDKKADWAQAFERYLVEGTVLDLYQRYGSLYHLQDTASIFEDQKDFLLKDWQACLSSVGRPATVIEIENMEVSMNTVIEASLVYCRPQHLNVKQNNYDETVEIEADADADEEQDLVNEQENNAETENQNELMNEQDTPLPTIVVSNTALAPFVPWELDSLRHFATPHVQSNVILTSLNKLASLETKDDGFSMFSDSLLVSENFSNIYAKQTTFFNSYIKKAFVVLFRLYQDKLTACLICNEEAEIWSQFFKTEQINAMWTSTADGCPLSGIQPDAIQINQDYLELLEQVQLFNGQLNLLFNQKNRLTWLMDNTEEKLHFFQTYLLPYREIMSNDFVKFKSIFSGRKSGYHYIKGHTFDEDLLQINWEKKSSLVTAEDIFAFESLARACIAANRTLPKDAELLIKEYSLDKEARTYLDEHLKHLHAVQKYIEAICHPDYISLTDLSVATIKKVAHAREEQLCHKNRFFSSHHENNNLRALLLFEVNGSINNPGNNQYHPLDMADLNAISTLNVSQYYDQGDLSMR